jgi:hypothetical protein
MRAAPGVSCVCSDAPRAKFDRMRVENVFCRLIRVRLMAPTNVRTVFWRTTGRDTTQGRQPDGSAEEEPRRGQHHEEEAGEGRGRGSPTSREA